MAASEYNYKKIRNNVAALVKESSYSSSNPYKNTVWQFHIGPVVEHSLILGKKLKADLEVLELSALLHDIAAISNRKYADEHHLYGAKMAKRILGRTSLPKEKTTKVINCILNHRGSKHGRRQSLEEKILASADAMSHFTELADMMCLTYGIHKLETIDGAIWLKSKLARSWKKIMPAGKKLIMSDYRAAMKILNKAISRSKNINI